MANRNVYLSNIYNPSKFKIISVEFEWHSGFSLIQKQRSIDSLHKNFNKLHPEIKVLEISTKSNDELGRKLSAFNLKYFSRFHNKNISVETAFQSSKVFEEENESNIDIINMNSYESKKYMREKQNKKLKYFKFENNIFELEPKTLFYDWLYINALIQNKDLINEVIQYDAFTDIEFNDKKSINCQAKSMALFIGLIKNEKYKCLLENLTKENLKSMLLDNEEIEIISFLDKI